MDALVPEPGALSPARRRALLLGAAGLALAALLYPTVAAELRERRAVRGFERELFAIELARQDRLVKDVGDQDRARTVRWEFVRTHELVRAQRAAPAPRFAKRMSLLTGVYDRAAKFERLAERLGELTARSLRLTPAELDDAARSQRALRELEEARRISAELRGALVGDHELARGAIAHSGLPEPARAQVWRVADGLFVMQLAAVAAAEQAAPEIARNQRLLRHLDEWRGAWQVTRGGVVRFHNPLAQARFDHLLWQLKEEAKQHPPAGD